MTQEELSLHIEQQLILDEKISKIAEYIVGKSRNSGYQSSSLTAQKGSLQIIISEYHCGDHETYDYYIPLEVLLVEDFKPVVDAALKQREDEAQRAIEEKRKVEEEIQRKRDIQQLHALKLRLGIE